MARLDTGLWSPTALGVVGPSGAGGEVADGWHYVGFDDAVVVGAPSLAEVGVTSITDQREIADAITEAMCQGSWDLKPTGPGLRAFVLRRDGMLRGLAVTRDFNGDRRVVEVSYVWLNVARPSAHPHRWRHGRDHAGDARRGSRPRRPWRRGAPRRRPWRTFMAVTDTDHVLVFGGALLGRAADLLEFDVRGFDLLAIAAAQMEDDLFEATLDLGDFDIDSLSLLEIVATIEGDLDVLLFDEVLDDWDGSSRYTLRVLCESVLRTARPDRIAAFVAAWLSPSAHA